MSDLVFLSFSKSKSEKLAKLLKGLIDTVFDKNKFDFFYRLTHMME